MRRRHPENVPWTALDLRRPIGSFTGRKLNALGEDPARCRALLTEAGDRASPRCRRAMTGRNAAMATPSAWRRRRRAARRRRHGLPGRGRRSSSGSGEIVQPAARRHFGRPVAAIDHFGSYSCRRLYGREEGGWSEHARANALDIAGFRLAGGARITVAADWRDPRRQGPLPARGPRRRLRLFATVLSPDYNAAHRDHFHLDQARRGRGLAGVPLGERPAAFAVAAITAVAASRPAGRWRTASSSSDARRRPRRRRPGAGAAVAIDCEPLEGARRACCAPIIDSRIAQAPGKAIPSIRSTSAAPHAADRRPVPDVGDHAFS